MAISSAIVFIKPHAVNDNVKKLVAERFAKESITILTEGNITAETIDADMLIDTHYGAIANRAMKQKPADLAVKDEAKELFQTKFGLSWADALAQGSVYNLADGAAKLGISLDQLGTEFDELKKGETMLKFGGGFYCGKLRDVYVINGFYARMRQQYTTPGTSIYYYEVQWETSKLPWASFRGNILGATDPTAAGESSLRGAILKDWQALGLDSEPNTGNNGLHASASPFEAMAERANWLKRDLKNDKFCREMVAAAVPLPVLRAWCDDPAVSFDGKKQSLFDLLEDIDGPESIGKAAAINASNPDMHAGLVSSAIVFIKPHAAGCDKVKKLVADRFDAEGIRIVSEGTITAETIDKDMLIDTHYGAIANRAMKQKPAELAVKDEAKELFQTKFGLSWADALSQGLVFNLADGAEKLGMSLDQLGEEFDTLKKGETMLKFGGGFYCGKLRDVYVINGFYARMRGQFTAPGTCIYYYEVEFSTAKLPWPTFRGSILGATDPAAADPSSLRGAILAKWQDLGLDSEPNTGNNGLHASASPFEAMSERANWLKRPLADDHFCKAMVQAGVPVGAIESWCGDPAVNFDGKKQSLFDLLEDIDGAPTLAKAASIQACNQ